jgi:5-(carboxyamino)imidazole ribonucleotide synthase
MVNSIGALPNPEAVLGVEGVHLHCYGKAPRRGRKVGHATLVEGDADRLGPRLEELRRALPADDG